MTDADKLTRIGEACALAFGTTPADLTQGSKHKEPTQARVVAMWIASKLMPDLNRRKIAQAYGRRDGDAVSESVRRVLDLRAINSQFREQADDLRRLLETEIGVTLAQPKPKQKDGGPIGASEDYSWGFSGLNTGSRYYFEEQNKRFTEAMLKAGEVPRVATE